MTSTPLPESAVLVERDPADLNPDDWPEFRLKDVTVTLPDSNEPFSLLLACEGQPVTVTGRLVQPRDNQEHLWRQRFPSRKGPVITIRDVRSFAYGAYEDGSVELWASGKAGWFVVNPARAYKEIHRQMCDAVKILFFIVDAYSLPASNPSLDGFFIKYAGDVLKDSRKEQEAREAVHTHSEFLMSSMAAGKEGINWTKNPVYRYLCRSFPEDHKAIRERLAAPTKNSSDTAGKQARQESMDSTSTSSTLKRKRGRPPKSRSVDVISISSSSGTNPMKKELPQKSAPKPKDLPRSAPVPTRRTRNTSPPVTQSETPDAHISATPAQDSESDDEHPRNAGKGKSVLRLKPSKPIKGPPKGMSKKGKAPVRDEDEPRSSPVPGKRRGEAPTANRRSKRRNSKPELDEGIDIPTSPSTNPDSDAEAGASDPNHPPLSDALAAHKPDPLQESTWLCALDSCTHKIYGDPSDPVSQRLIREHYALHAYDDDQRVQLVKRLQAPSMPVNRLMEKVKVAAKSEGFPGSKVAGTRFPEPLRTRY